MLLEQNEAYAINGGKADKKIQFSIYSELDFNYMKQLFSILVALLFIGCNTLNKMKGRYENGNTIEFIIKDIPKEFEYFLKSEMGTLQYSKGRWELNKDRMRIFGFNRDNLKNLDVESIVNKNVGVTKVEIYYNTDNAATYIKSVIVINDNKIYPIAKDTVFFPGYNVETIQVKSYLSYTGLLSSNPQIDTLYSSKINIDNTNGKSINIILKFSVHPYDFVRVPLNDTLTVKNSRLIYYKKTKLKKSDSP